MIGLFVTDRPSILGLTEFEGVEVYHSECSRCSLGAGRRPVLFEDVGEILFESVMCEFDWAETGPA